MRIRSIKPEFFKHDVLASMSPLNRLLFIGLWCMADCAGRLEDRPARVKVEVLPYDAANIDTMLSELCSAGFIVRYVVGEQRIIQIPSFLTHQRISGKEADATSKFPAASQKRMVKQRGSNGASPGITGDGRETEGKGKDDAFAQFWAAYPKKKAKESAEKAFVKVTAPIDTLLLAIGLSKNDPDWKKDGGKFIPYPATWLNGKRWEDQPESGCETLQFAIPIGEAKPYDAKPEY